MARIDTIDSQPDPASINLSRILLRLERTVLSEDSDPELLRSSYERTKVGANVEYARSLLLRLEHDTSNIKTASRKQAIQTDLQAKRDLIKRLQTRLQELNQLEDEDESSEDEEDDDKAPSYAPASKASIGIDTEKSSAQEAAEHLSSTLRSRNPQSTSSTTPSATTTQSRYGNTSTSQENSKVSVEDRESRLTADRSEQESITASLITLAQALKSSAQTFHSSVEAEKDIVKRAADGLDKNVTGMAVTGEKMNALSGSSAADGWLSKLGLPDLRWLLLYGKIAGLWVAAILLVFVGPKLRF